MRKQFFSLIFIFSCASYASADQSYFLIIKGGSDATVVSKTLQSKGISIQQSMPPSILVVKAPEGFIFSDISAISKVYSSIVPSQELKALGPLGVAAGVEWNREIINSRGGQSNAISAQQVSSELLSSPENVRAHIEGNFLSANWDEVPGILFYEVELRSEKTGDLIIHTKADGSFVLLAVNSDIDSRYLFLRIRACERPDALDPAKDTVGEWSPNITMEMPLGTKSEPGPTPVLSSPIDGYETVGLLADLEWNSDSAHEFRLQVSPDPNFQTTLIDVGLKGNEYIVPSSALHVGDVLFWRLQAWGAIKSDWTPARKIRIGNPRPIDSDMMINPEAPR